MTDTKFKIGAKYRTLCSSDTYECIGFSPSGKPIVKRGFLETIINGNPSIYREVRESRRMKYSVLENIYDTKNTMLISHWNHRQIGTIDGPWKKIDEIEWVEKI